MLSAPRTTVETLREQVAHLEQTQHPTWETFGTSCAALDRLLPDQGLRRGTLVEWLCEPGCGATAVALIAAREASRPEATLVVIDGQQNFYPLAAVALGIDLSQLVIVRPKSAKDYLWSLHQSLSCPGVAAVLSWPEKLPERAFRALQLAAETSGAIGLLVRPLAAQNLPTWSELQLLVTSLPSSEMARRLQLTLVRCRHGQAGASIELELDDETGRLQESHPLHLASSLARTAVTSDSARA